MIKIKRSWSPDAEIRAEIIHAGEQIVCVETLQELGAQLEFWAGFLEPNETLEVRIESAPPGFNPWQFRQGYIDLVFHLPSGEVAPVYHGGKCIFCGEFSSPQEPGLPCGWCGAS